MMRKLSVVSFIVACLVCLTNTQALPPLNKCNLGCTSCVLGNAGTYCTYCAGTRLVDQTCQATPATPFCIYHKGTNLCEYCEAGYTHKLDNTCQKASINNNNSRMRNCAFSYTDASGIDGCNGCRQGFVMNSSYNCVSPFAGNDPNCLYHGFSRSDNTKRLRCLQCFNGYYLDANNRCSAIPALLEGCAVPDQFLQNCYWCDGYHGFYEYASNQQGYKLCKSGGINFYQKSKETLRTSGSIYFEGLFLAILTMLLTQI